MSLGSRTTVSVYHYFMSIVICELDRKVFWSNQHRFDHRTGGVGWAQILLDMVPSV